MLLATLFRGFSTKNPLITEATSKKKASNEHLNRLYEEKLVKLLNEFYSQSTEKSYGLLGNLLGLKPWEANSLIRTIDNFFKLNNNTKNHSDITTNYIDSFESLANSIPIQSKTYLNKALKYLKKSTKVPSTSSIISGLSGLKNINKDINSLVSLDIGYSNISWCHLLVPPMELVDWKVRNIKSMLGHSPINTAKSVKEIVDSLPDASLYVVEKQSQRPSIKMPQSFQYLLRLNTIETLVNSSLLTKLDSNSLVTQPTESIETPQPPQFSKNIVERRVLSVRSSVVEKILGLPNIYWQRNIVSNVLLNEALRQTQFGDINNLIKLTELTTDLDSETLSNSTSECFVEEILYGNKEDEEHKPTNTSLKRKVKDIMKSSYFTDKNDTFDGEKMCLSESTKETRSMLKSIIISNNLSKYYTLSKRKESLADCLLQAVFVVRCLKILEKEHE